MVLRNRLALARLGAVGVLVAGAIAVAGNPAQAAAADFKVSFVGTTLAANVDGKLASVKVANVGEAAAGGDALVDFDISDLDQDVVELALTDTCDVDGDHILCGLPADALPAPGSSIPFATPLARKAGATGLAGTITVTVTVPGDTVATNNSDTANVVVSGSGADIIVVAEDLGGGTDSAQKVHPGETGVLALAILNQGDAVADGIKLTVNLPEHTTVADDNGCAVSADRRTLTCEDADLELIPIAEDADPDSDEDGTGFIVADVEVAVAADAPAPVTLQGTAASAALAARKGEAAIEDAQESQEDASEVFEEATAEDLAEIVQEVVSAEVDDTDNTDDFAVYVTAKSSGGGGGTGDDGGLPVTGDNVGLLAGVGGGVLALGAVLFMVARRRRVVLATPGDERPTA